MYITRENTRQHEDFTVEAGHYEGTVNLVQLCKEIFHDHVEEAGQILFTWNPTANKVSLSFGENMSLIINSFLMEKLELTKELNRFEEDGEYKSNLAADPNCGFKSPRLLRLKQSATRRLPFFAWPMGTGTLETRYTVCVQLRSMCLLHRRNFILWKFI